MTIQAYSKKKDGNKKLSANFRVREFACTDGSDPIFIDTDLVKILHHEAPTDSLYYYKKLQ